MQWDVFCRVIDNFGDIGVCWRLSADLAMRGETVRLWVDDASALVWMAPHGAPGVTVLPWPQDDTVRNAPGDVVIEAFGCDLPAVFVNAMAQQRTPPVWINLEYLSAEPYVARSHRLPSPQRNGLVKWFFYPGFTAATGGLLREPGLLEGLDALDVPAWLRSHDIDIVPGERRVSLFCYENGALPALLDALSHAPTLLLVAGTQAQWQLNRLLGHERHRGALRVQMLPAWPQPDYDRLLRSCHLNFVRGEDSFVRAQWAGRPFVWQIYPQNDGAHAAKLDAFLDLYLRTAEPALATGIRALFHRWNGLGTATQTALPPAAVWADHASTWLGSLVSGADLSTQLAELAFEKRGGSG